MSSPSTFRRGALALVWGALLGAVIGAGASQLVPGVGLLGAVALACGLAGLFTGRPMTSPGPWLEVPLRVLAAIAFGVIAWAVAPLAFDWTAHAAFLPALAAFLGAAFQVDHARGER